MFPRVTAAADRLLNGRGLRHADAVPRAELLPQLGESRVGVRVRRVLREYGAHDGAEDVPTLPPLRRPPLPEDAGEVPVQRDDVRWGRPWEADEGRALGAPGRGPAPLGPLGSANGPSTYEEGSTEDLGTGSASQSSELDEHPSDLRFPTWHGPISRSQSCPLALLAASGSDGGPGQADAVSCPKLAERLLAIG